MGRRKVSFFNRIREFFGKGDGDEFINLTSDIPLSTLARWYIYDTGMGNEREVAAAVGLTPVSEEGHKKEQQDSEARLSILGPLFPYLDYISTIAADAVVSMQMPHVQQAHPDVDHEAEADLIFSLYKSLSLSSLIGAFSIGLDLRLVSLDAVSSDVIDIPYGEEDKNE